MPPRRTRPTASAGFPADVDLDLVVRSHGWYDLPPFSYDAAACRLSFVALLDGEPASIAVEQRDGAIRVSRPRAAEKRAVEAVVARVLQLDVDLAPFHALCESRAGDGFSWIARARAGRMLRAPSLFEDAVKVLATTNCSWGLTKAMVRNLIEAFGREGAFPDAAFLSGLSEKRLREEIRLGYRAPYLAEFSRAVASGRLDLSRWEEPERPDAEVEKEIRAWKGFGPYAADTLGRLLGRHGKLGLDSWSRKKVAELRFKGRVQKDARVAKLYAPFGRFAGLAFWLDVTRDWHAHREELWS